MISLRKYATVSCLAAGAVIYHAFATRQHFFPATLYLSTSKLAVAICGNLSFAMCLVFYRVIIKVFLGTLREVELERINERLSSAIMETCLALTIFREEFNMSFVAMFTMLTFLKVFHWLVQDRVEYIEVTPHISRFTHIRITSFMALLLMVDSMFLQSTISTTLATGGHSVQLLFAFEYIILASTIIATFLKYTFSMVDSYMEGRWESKGTYVFYLELVTDLLHLFVYCVFFVIVFTHYGLPLHLMRDLYATFRNFRNRITDFLRFRRVTARMDRFPDATAEDLERCDGICIICREEMSTNGNNKKLTCGHVFHLHCLRSWLERQQNCPTCRAPVFRPRQQAAPAEPEAPQEAAPGAEAAAAGAAAGAPAAQGAPQNRGMLFHGPELHGPMDYNAGMAALARLAQQAAAQPQREAQGAQGGQAAAAAAGAAAPAAAAPGAPAAPAAAAAPATGGAAAAAPAAAAPGMPGAGYVWQAPQYFPMTSMAAFPPPAGMQYAGQQMAGMMPMMMPMAGFPGINMASITPEQHQAAAAAAAMAAAAAAMYSPMGLVMMPPTMPGAPVAAGQQQGDGMQASLEATQLMLQQQMALLQSQLEQLRAAGAAAGPSSQQQAAGGAAGEQQQTGGSSSAAAAGSSAPAAASTAPAPETQQADEGLSGDDPASELRRRRLARFSQQEQEQQ